MTPRWSRIASAEGGFALLEVLVSAVVLVIASAGVFGLVQTTTRSAGEERHGSEAYAIAQEDQARLRSMRLEALNHLYQKREIPLSGAMFSVESSGEFINDKTSTVSCTEGATADYVEVTSKVTWPGMASSEAAKIVSIVSKTNQSFVSGRGTIRVVVANELGDPMPGVELKGLGSAGATTNEEGCATFPDLPSGNYTLESSGATAGLVNRNVNTSEKTLVGIEVNGNKKVALLYDRPGTIPVEFKYRVGSSPVFQKASADSVVALNTGMTTAKVFGTPGGSRLSEVKAGPLFPFAAPDTVYAGSCASSNPNPQGETNPPGAAAIGSAVVPAGGIAVPVTIQLPALNLTVLNGVKKVSGARVTITDSVCEDTAGSFVKRVYATNENGNQSAVSTGPTGPAEPGLPWGIYNICASARVVEGKTENDRRIKKSAISVKNLTSGTTLTLDLSGSGSESGKTCP